jgi:hypothetical protein
MGIFSNFFPPKQPAPPCEIHPDDKDLVRPEDIEWWNSLSLDDCKAFGVEDEVFRVAAWRKFVETDGLSDADAGRKVCVSFPGYYYKLADRTSEKFQLTGPDALLPFVLKERVNQAVMHGIVEKRAIQSASSVNALVRQLIRAGRLTINISGAFSQATEPEIEEYRAAEVALENAIRERSKLFFGYGLLALIAYPFAEFGPSWVRWIGGFFIAILLLGEMGMVGALRRLQKFRWPFRADHVMRNHYGFAAFGILALTYALCGIWGRWPVPWIALLIGVFVNVVHGFGYGQRKVDG